MKVASKVDGGCWAAERNEHGQSCLRIHTTVSLKYNLTWGSSCRRSHLRGTHDVVRERCR